MQLLNENHYDEMCAILLDLQSHYCPVIKCPDHNSSETEVQKYFQLLFDGDQLTKVRTCGAIRLRETHSPDEQINAFVPVITDWHARMTLVTVSLQCISSLIMLLNRR